MLTEFVIHKRLESCAVQYTTISDKSFVQSKPFLDKAWMIITTFWKNYSDKGDDPSSNKLRAHRLVLGAASPFLKAVFSDIPQVRSQHSNLFTVCFCYHEKLLPSASGSQLFATVGEKCQKTEPSLALHDGVDLQGHVEGLWRAPC